MQTLTLAWQGETVEFRPSFDLFMRIEEKVSINRLAHALNQAGLGNVAEMPMSHVAWVVYCCLRHAGVAVRTPEEVHRAIFDGQLETQGVLGGLIVAYYGAQPQKPPKKKAAATPKSSRPLGPTSKSATE